MTEQISDYWIAVQAAIYAFPIFIIINAIIAAFKVKGEERKIGKWIDNRFIYNEPLYVDAVSVTSDKEEQYFDLVLHDAEPNSTVQTKITMDNVNGRTKAIIWPINGNSMNIHWDWINPLSKATVKIGKDRKARLFVNIKPNNDKTTISVYLLSWEL